MAASGDVKMEEDGSCFTSTFKLGVDVDEEEDEEEEAAATPPMEAG